MSPAQFVALPLLLGACGGGHPTLVDPDATIRFSALDEVEPTVEYGP